MGKVYLGERVIELQRETEEIIEKYNSAKIFKSVEYEKQGLY